MPTGDERTQLLHEIDGYLVAARDTREALVGVESPLQRMRTLVGEGLEVRPFLSSFPGPSAGGADLADSQKALQVAQLRTRRQIAQMGRAEGLSLAPPADF